MCDKRPLCFATAGFHVVKYLRVGTKEVKVPIVADILLVLDESRSILAKGDDILRNWRVVRDFAKSVAGSFPIASNRTQVGVLKFSKEAKVVFDLNAYSSRESLLNAIGNIRHEGRGTNLAAALKTGRSRFTTSNGARNGVPKILIMLTDGTASVEADRTQEEANITKAGGITIFTVGVGNSVDKNELQKVASKPEFFFFATDFTDLNSILQKLLDKSHKVTTTIPTTTMQPSISTKTTTRTTTTELCKSLPSYFLVASECRHVLLSFT